MSLRSSPYLSAPMLPRTMTAPMMPIRLYFGTVLESCLRITMCMSSLESTENKEVRTFHNNNCRRGGKLISDTVFIGVCTWM